MVSGDLCFVIMPFRPLRAPGQAVVDFDGIFARIIVPAVTRAGLIPHRADEEITGGIFQKTMFERLALCEYCVADVSRANPNVYYELGIRHALRPWSTVVMFCDDSPLPLDIAQVAALPYPANVLEDARAAEMAVDGLVKRLRAAQRGELDSPVFQLVSGLATPELDHGRAEAVLEAMKSEGELGRRIARASDAGLDAVRELRDELGSPTTMRLQTVLSLLLTFRGHEAWPDMARLIEAAPGDVAGVWLVQEQYALALGRLGRFREAEEILRRLLGKRRNSETWGILGGIYRREWEALIARKARGSRVCGALHEACDAYLAGFMCDSRDPFPGVNAVGLLQIAGREDEARRLLPVVRFTVEVRLSSAEPEYWDYASLLQIALLGGDATAARGVLPRLVRAMRTPFEGHCTLDGLRVLTKHIRGEDNEVQNALTLAEEDLGERLADLEEGLS